MYIISLSRYVRYNCQYVQYKFMYVCTLWVYLRMYNISLCVYIILPGEVVPALDIAVGTMKKGETSKFLFQPEYFLGSRGCPPRIPADSPVMFVIDLINYVECAGVDDFYRMPMVFFSKHILFRQNISSNIYLVSYMLD